MRIGFLGVGRIGASHAAVVARHEAVTSLVVADADSARARAVADELGAERRGRRGRGPRGRRRRDRRRHRHRQPRRADCRWARAPAFPCSARSRSRSTWPAPSGAGRGARGRHVPVQVGFQRRFDAGYVAARDALQQRPPGLAAHGAAVTADPAPAARVATSRRPAASSATALIHDFDIVRWVTGREVVEVLRRGRQPGRRRSSPRPATSTTAVAMLTLDDGTLRRPCTARATTAPATTCGWRSPAPTRPIAVGLDEHAALRSAEPGVDVPGRHSQPDVLRALRRRLRGRDQRVRRGRPRRAVRARARSRTPWRRSTSPRPRAVAARGPARRDRRGAQVTGSEADAAVRIAGAPISWGVCEVPGWGHQLRTGAGAARDAPTSASPPPSSARTASCPPTRSRRADAARRPRPACGRRVRPGRAARPLRTTRCPRSSGPWRASSRPARDRLVLAAATGAEGYDARPVLDDARLEGPARQPRPDRATSPASTGVAATLHPHVGTMVETAEEVDRVLDRRGDRALPRHRAPARRRRRPGRARPGGHRPDRATRTSRTSTPTSAERVRAGELTYTDGGPAGHLRPLGQGDVDIAGDRRATLERRRLPGLVRHGAGHDARRRAAGGRRARRRRARQPATYLRARCADRRDDRRASLTIGRVGVDIYPSRSACRSRTSRRSASSSAAAPPTSRWPRPGTAAASRGHHPHRRRPVRPLRPQGAARLRRRRPRT